MKATLQNLLFIVTLLMSLNRVAIAQVGVMPTYPDHKLGPYSGSHRFKEVSMAAYGYKSFHHFKPKSNKTKGYYDTGKRFRFRENETIELAQLYQGEYDDKKGLWIHPFDPSYAYIFLGDVIDIEKEVQAAEVAGAKARQELKEEERAEQIRTFFKFLPYALGFLGLIVLLNCLSSICPKCGAWWKRQHERTESLGSSTYSGTRSARKDVYNSSGSIIGHTFIDEPYTKTTYHYRKHYKCKRCGHKWTKDKDD